jgi:hypothetical protein
MWSYGWPEAQQSTSCHTATKQPFACVTRKHCSSAWQQPIAPPPPTHLQVPVRALPLHTYFLM